MDIEVKLKQLKIIPTLRYIFTTLYRERAALAKITWLPFFLLATLHFFISTWMFSLPWKNPEKMIIFLKYAHAITPHILEFIEAFFTSVAAVGIYRYFLADKRFSYHLWVCGEM